MQIKATVRYRFSPIENGYFLKINEDVENLELKCTADGRVQQSSQCGKLNSSKKSTELGCDQQVHFWVCIREK
jgi:hypothetical protein